MFINKLRGLDDEGSHIDQQAQPRYYINQWRKDLQQYGDKAQSIMTAQQQLVDTKMFTPVEAWKPQPE